MVVDAKQILGKAVPGWRFYRFFATFLLYSRNQVRPMIVSHMAGASCEIDIRYQGDGSSSDVAIYDFMDP